MDNIKYYKYLCTQMNSYLICYQWLNNNINLLKNSKFDVYSYTNLMLRKYKDYKHKVFLFENNFGLAPDNIYRLDTERLCEDNKIDIINATIRYD